MQRRSDTHSPRIDDELAHDVSSLVHGAPSESRGRSERLQEDTTADPVDIHTSPPPGDYPEMSAADSDLRSLLARSLRPGAFPAERDELLRVAVEEHAPSGVLELLRQLDAGRYQTLEAVWEALGGHREADRHGGAAG